MPGRLTKLREWVANPHRISLVDWLQQRHRRKREEQIRTTAYYLWEADGKPESQDEYYWRQATDKVNSTPISTQISQSLYNTEKRLETLLTWMKTLAILEILGLMGNLTIFIGLLTYIAGEKQRRDAKVYQAWQIISIAYDQPGSGGRKEALEFLNSQPRRFPWFWLQWDRESLQGLVAPKALLYKIKLPNADLSKANLQKANLARAKLKNANLRSANLKNAHLTFVNLKGAYLVKANLKEAKLENANLSNANLIFANLKQAYLVKANLKQAYLVKANLRNANLKDVNLQDAYYTNDNTSSEVCDYLLVKQRKYCSTIFPKGFDPQAEGMKLILEIDDIPKEFK